MRIEILVIAALAAFASAAPQWPYRDAVAPYYYGYPGKTPYIYASGDEDDEREESTSLARQDLKVATSDGGSTVVVEDDEKADGVRVVETGSAKPLKPVVQSASNNQQNQQQDQQQPVAASSQAQQPLSSNNANNVQTPASGQPLTVQQSGQQPPAFPPARPPKPPQQRPADEDEEDEEDEESEEDDEDAEDEEDDGDDDDDDDEEDDEERRRNNIAQKEAPSSEEPAPLPAVAQEEPLASLPVSEGSDEVVQEAHHHKATGQPAVPVHHVPSQSALLNNKINKNKQSGVAAAAPVPVVPVKSKNKPVKPVTTKVKQNSGAIEALVPGYVTDQGEVLVPVDTVTGSQPITIVPDPFSPPSRIVSGPRPIPQSAVPSSVSRQVPYWYRSSHAGNPLTDDAPRQTLFTPVPPPGSIFTFDDDDEDDDDDESVAPGNRLRQGEPPFFAQKHTKFYYRPLFDY